MISLFTSNRGSLNELICVSIGHCDHWLKNGMPFILIQGLIEIFTKFDVIFLYYGNEGLFDVVFVANASVINKCQSDI